MLAMMLLSHAGDDVAGETWSWCDVDTESCWRQCGRAMLATTLLGRLGRSTMKMSSHVGDGAAKSCWR
jgi:hypothetical protein